MLQHAGPGLPPRAPSPPHGADASQLWLPLHPGPRRERLNVPFAERHARTSRR